MKLKNISSIPDGKFLHLYQLDYGEKSYELVSRNRILNEKDIGDIPSGVAVIVTAYGRLLLLKEFRMAVNSFVYNLCEGMLEQGESPQECAMRELKEETGLEIKKFHDILIPCYPAPAFSDVGHHLIFADAEGVIKEQKSRDEIIVPGLYDKKEVMELLSREKFSATAQLAAYLFAYGNQLWI